MGIYLNRVCKEILNEDMELNAYVDSKTLERTIKSTTGASSRMLRIELARIKQMLEEKAINQIEWIKRENQIADGLTREGGNRRELRKYVEGKWKKVGGGEERC